MKIGIPREILKNENRVAVAPGMVSVLLKNQNEVLVDSGAGQGAFFDDGQYREAGAVVGMDVKDLYASADVILKVQPLLFSEKYGRHEADLLREGAVVIGFMAPLANKETLRKLTDRKTTSFAMEYIPRITRAQGMDALSSQATVAGYKAALMAAGHIGKFFPLLMTAAGTIPPATVLVLGAGVAGLQAIATAKRLGARVEAFDPRPVVKEQVESLGAHFVEMEITENVETAGGYAKEQSEDFLRREQETIAARLGKVDVVITTAQIFGKPAPQLITEEMVKAMRPGSVIVDLAAEQGGNCALTEPDRTVVRNEVTIIGTLNLPSLIPTHASLMYSKNITNLFRHLFPAPGSPLDFSDEIVRGACITHQGEIVNEMVKRSVES